jgi:predicted HAD superfamily Cof-like phosphohydrolase
MSNELKGLDLAQAEVKKFHETFKHPISEKPTMLSIERLAQRNIWVSEELQESLEATDVIGQADAMIDAIYFLLGTLVEMGVKPQAIFEIVQGANMSKVFPDGQPRWNEVGKVIKPEGWVAPEPKIEAEIKRQSMIATSREIIENAKKNGVNKSLGEYSEE